ncbi:ATP-binding protein [Brevibacterium yomogidense]|uniref:ATP-binding protein n=1 Tax=Brevibacterium yomogidense TaxID=946573 RepID=UPI0018DF77FE|nr:DUF4143 domain-containing protein [Brevibacterium yomogidense]
MTAYLPRIVDNELARGLLTVGAVHIRGPRASGKTRTARQVCASEIRLDTESPEASLARMEPQSALPGPVPRLIDEWQAVPAIWNHVRHEVDDRAARGQFVLTGSATPADEAPRHSGAGRIRSLTMRTMTLQERGVDATPVSLASLFDGSLEPSSGTQASVSDYAEWMVRGGWPGWTDLDHMDAQDAVSSYLEEMSEHDFPELGGPRRDPRRFTAFLTAYAGLIGQPSTFAAIQRRMADVTGAAPSAELVSSLHGFAERLFVLEDQPSWSTRLRSKTPLVQTPKRHLADVSLALSLLRAGRDRLLTDLQTLGIAFESLAVHELRVAAQAIRARGVFHLRDTKGRDEIDIIVEDADGAWAGFEVKLSHQRVDEAAHQLNAVASKVERAPAALAIIVPSGPVVRRSDGVWVIPLASLSP